MTIHGALATVARTADGRKSSTVFDRILATIDFAQTLSSDPDIIMGCVHAMMQKQHSELQIVVPFDINDEGDWKITVRHFDGLEVMICHEADPL